MNKKRILVAAVLVAVFFSCDSSDQQDKDVDTTAIEEVEETPEVVNEKEEINLEQSDKDFFTVCENLELWNGGIQGVESSDSTGPYIMGQCFGNEHFDIIVYADREIELSEAIIKHKALNPDLKGAKYFAFQLPKVPKEEPEDEFDLYEYVYPSEVKVYQLMQGEWYLVKTDTINSFEELGRLKLNTIFE